MIFGHLFIFFCPLNVQQIRLHFPVYTTLTNYVAVCHTNQREHNFYTVYMKFRLQAFIPKKVRNKYDIKCIQSTNFCVNHSLENFGNILDLQGGTTQTQTFVASKQWQNENNEFSFITYCSFKSKFLLFSEQTLTGHVNNSPIMQFWSGFPRIIQSCL